MFCNLFLIYLVIFNEIYIFGYCNLYYFFFVISGGCFYVIVVDMGWDNIEEIDILQFGGNYGWGDREGIFVYNCEIGFKGMGYGLDYGVLVLLDDEWVQNDYIYFVV